MTIAMATELELALFGQELEEIKLLPEAPRWAIERDHEVPLGLYATMHPLAHPDHRYKARIRWTNYFAPFSLKFVNLRTNSDGEPSAWPKCYGFRPSSLDVCLPWTAEGLQLHPEWRTSARHAVAVIDAPMQHALLRVQDSLDNTYEGRGP